MKSTYSIVAAGVSVSLLAAGAVRADVTVTDVRNSAEPPTLDSSFGTIELALNVGNGPSLERDGISFAGSGVTGSPPIVYDTANGIAVGGSAFAGNFNNATIGGDELFHTESWLTSQDGQSVVVSSLDPSMTYQIQILHGEGRALIYDNGAIAISDDAGGSADFFLTFGPGGSDTEYAVATFEVTAATSVSYTMPNAGRGPSFAGIVVSSSVAPEPDSDGDGFTDAFEVSLGTNPNDPASTPESRSSLEFAVEFGFYAARNKTYRIETSTDLQAWTIVEDEISGRGGKITRLYSLTGQPVRHFRAVRDE